MGRIKTKFDLTPYKQFYTEVDSLSEYLLKINTMAEEYHEENPNRVTCEKTEGLNPSSNNDPSIPIFQALKDREYDGKFKKGTRIHTVDRTVIQPHIVTTHHKTHYF